MTDQLRDIQAKFQSRLVDGDNAIGPSLDKAGPFMGVYDHAYRARLIEILSEDFEGVHTLLGDEQFARAMRGYVDAHPSTTKSVRWLGRYLANYLKRTEPWNDLPMVSSMAAFEWMLGLAFDAPDAPLIDVDEISAVPPEAWPMVTITFHPAFNTALLMFDVAPFYQAVKAEEEPSNAPEKYESPVTWAAWRDPEMLTVTYRALDPDETGALDAARKGQTFDSICEIVAGHTDADSAAMRTAGLLRLWMESGWIVGVDADGMSW